MVVGLTALHALAIERRRPIVTLRGDLFRWLRRRSSLTGEPLPALTDRAVATYRHALADGDTGVGAGADTDPAPAAVTTPQGSDPG